HVRYEMPDEFHQRETNDYSQRFWQHFFPAQTFVFAVVTSAYSRHWLWLFLSEPINDAILCDAKQPRSHLFNGLHQSVGFDKFGGFVLQDVFYILVIADTLAGKIAETRLFLPECFSDPPLFIRPWLSRQRPSHLLL